MSYDMDDRYGFEWCASTRHGVFRQSAVSLLYQLMIFRGIFHFSLTTAFTCAFHPFFRFLACPRFRAFCVCRPDIFPMGWFHLWRDPAFALCSFSCLPSALGLLAFAVQTSSLWVGFISGVTLRLLFAFFAILARPA